MLEIEDTAEEGQTISFLRGDSAMRTNELRLRIRLDSDLSLKAVVGGYTKFR